MASSDQGRMWKIFLELHSDIPREGPGDSESTAKAFSMITGLPEKPRILDIGCGPGMQTLDLAQLSGGTITAVDYYRQYLDALEESATSAGLADRITTVEADMAALDFELETFDLIWSEGAAYIMGFDNALRSWKPLLKPSGWLAVTEAAWTRPDPPADLRQFWESEYPAIKDVEDSLALIRDAGYEITGHFKLPDASWWDHYYTPLNARIEIIRERYGDDPIAAAVIESHERERDMHRRYADYYGYVFFIMRAA
jgi:SAM-dependent methyltransferase